MGYFQFSACIALKIAPFALLAACAAPPALSPALQVSGVKAAQAPARAIALDSCGIPGLREAVMHEVNAARRAGHTCGNRRMGPANPLAWNPALFTAATLHSRDMAARNYFDHRSPEGDHVAQRVSAQGYAWRNVGENLGGGDTSVQGVVTGWLESSSHCQNMMNPSYHEIGVACVQQPGTRWGTYWTMVLGRR